MKTKKTILILPAFLLVFISCNEDNNNDKESTQETIPCHCIMDTLKGEWSWVKTYGGFLGKTTDNEFKSIIKILSQNEDASINYEVFVKDELYHKGNFQFQYSLSNNRIDNINIRLPHWIPSLLVDENWIIYTGNMLLGGISNENTLCFWDGAEDGYFYYYQKTGKE